MNAIIRKVQEMRNKTAKTCCSDMFFSDGTIAYNKEKGFDLLRSYDDLLYALGHWINK